MPSSAKAFILSSILENLPLMVYWKDLDSIYLGCNQLFALYSGYASPKEVIGKTDAELHWGSDTRKHQRDDQRIIKKDTARLNSVETIFCADGVNRTVLSNKMPLRDKSGKIIGILGTATDITKEKKREKRLIKKNEKIERVLKLTEENNRAKDQFLSSCGHELRTPLANISGPAQALLEDIDDPYLSVEERKKFVKYIVDHAFQLEHLIEDVITFSVTGLNWVKIHIEPVDLHKIIESAHGVYQHKMLNGVLLEYKYPKSLSRKVLGDKLRVSQVVTNLINNAVKFTEKGVITLGVEQDKENKGYLRIYIKDTGLGIAPDKLSEVWEELNQVHSELDDQQMGRHHGLGLGLSIVKELVERMDGQVGVESELGKGSVFYFTLPVEV